LSIGRQVRDDFGAVFGIEVVHDRAHRDANLLGFSIAARPILALALRPVLGLNLAPHPVIVERRHVALGDDVDITTAAAISAAGPAARDELLTAKRDTTVATAASFYADRHFVDERFVRTHCVCQRCVAGARINSPGTIDSVGRDDLRRARFEQPTVYPADGDAPYGAD